jgi:anti-sigma factor RsiW
MSVFDRISGRLRSRKAVGSLACNELVEMITDYLEGTLPPRQRARFDAHLDQCEGCRAYLEQMRLTIQTVGRIREDSVPVPMRKTLLHAFRSWKER